MHCPVWWHWDAHSFRYGRVIICPRLWRQILIDDPKHRRSRDGFCWSYELWSITIIVVDTIAAFAHYVVEWLINLNQKTVNDTECAYCIHVGQARWFQGIVGCRGTEQTCCFCHWKILKVQIGLWFFLNIHPFRLVTQISRKNYVKVLLASQPGRQWILSGALDVASAQLCHVHELLPRLHRNPSALKLALSWRWCQLEKEGCSPVNSVTLDRESIQRVTFHRSWRCFYELQTERDQEGNVRIPASQQTIYENMCIVIVVTPCSCEYNFHHHLIYGSISLDASSTDCDYDQTVSSLKRQGFWRHWIRPVRKVFLWPIVASCNNKHPMIWKIVKLLLQHATSCRNVVEISWNCENETL